METEKMIKKSDSQGYYITNFGAIAAARNLNNFDNLARKTIRIIQYKGSNKLTTEKEFSGEKGCAIGFHEQIQ
jgi:ATP-dependent DNA helicase RecG